MVGLFFIIDGEIYADAYELEEVEPVNGLLDGYGSHYEYWEALTPFYAEFQGHDYDYYPRGRVIFNANSQRYKIILDTCIQDPSHIRKIADTFNLREQAYSIESDEHYQCHSCNSEYCFLVRNPLRKPPGSTGL